MKEILLDVHSTYCEIQTKHEREKKNEWADYCIRTPKKILFLAGNQFYLVTYFTCMEQGGRLDFIQDTIKQCLGSTKIFPKYEVNRCRVNEDLKEYRLRGKALKKYIEQVNYLYDASGREYAITTKADYIEAIVGDDKLTENYEIAKKFLEGKNDKYFLGELKDLYLANCLWVDDIEVIKSVDNLIDKINNNLKQTTNGHS